MDHGERTLLIVDDDQAFGQTLAAEFRDRGYSVEWLAGLQAVEQERELDYHYAVIDLRLGQDTGLDVIKVLKARSPATILLLLTGHGSDEAAREAARLGASAYLTKPVGVDQLERALLDACAVAETALESGS